MTLTVEYISWRPELSIIRRILVKLTSTKFVITLWSTALITFIVTKNIASMNNIALALTAVPVSYFVVNAVQKRNDMDSNRRGEERRYE